MSAAIQDLQGMSVAILVGLQQEKNYYETRKKQHVPHLQSWY